MEEIKTPIDYLEKEVGKDLRFYLEGYHDLDDKFSQQRLETIKRRIEIQDLDDVWLYHLGSVSDTMLPSVRKAFKNFVEDMPHIEGMQYRVKTTSLMSCHSVSIIYSPSRPVIRENVFDLADKYASYIILVIFILGILLHLGGFIK